MSKNKYAVAVMCDKGYLAGLQVCCYSVKKYSPDVDIIVYTSDAEVFHDPILAKLVTRFENNDDVNADVLTTFRAWRANFPKIAAEKLKIFGDSFGYDGICMLDADIIARKDFSELFLPGSNKIRGLKSAIKNGRTVIHGGTIFIPRRFLNRESYEKLITQCRQNGTPWEEWAIYSAFQNDIEFLPTRYVYSLRSKLRPIHDSPYFIHYIRVKPWNEYRSDATEWYALRKEMCAAYGVSMEMMPSIVSEELT